MAHIIIQINGRETTPETTANPLHGMIIKQMDEQMRQKLNGVVCTEHHVVPIVTINISGTTQHISVAGCCQSLIERAKQALTSLP